MTQSRGKTSHSGWGWHDEAAARRCYRRQPESSWAKDSHIPALLSLENVQLAAVATTSRASAEAAAAAFGVRAAYDDPLALITASDIDLVSVCVRVPYHRDLVLAALAADKHVYCEWPLGRDRGEAAEMAAAARDPRGPRGDRPAGPHEPGRAARG